MNLDELLRSGRLERVPADEKAAVKMLDEARAHLRSAESILSDDPDGAYSLFYDAARKAISAHMMARGLRARNQQGAHVSVGLYAVAEIRGTAVGRFDRPRRSRNRSEYGVRIFGDEELHRDLATARAIVREVDDS